MAELQHKNSDKKKRKRGNEKSVGRPFKKNDPATGFKDPNINRKGFLKPRSQKEFEALLDEIFDEDIQVETNGGEKQVMSKLRYASLNMLLGKDVKGQIELLARRFGKVPDKVTNINIEGDKVLPSLPADVIAPDFLNVYRDIKERRHTEYLEYGGRGSTKSSFISLVFIWLLVNNPEVHGVALRQVKDTLRDSVYGQLKWAINELGLSDLFHCTVSPIEIKYLPTGQTIYFRGADDPANIKSIKPPFGYLALLWFEELDQFYGAEAIRNIEQSALRGGELAWVFKSWNPSKTSANWTNKYIQIPKENQYKHVSSYLTVPPEWLGKVFIDDAEHLHNVNPKAYDHEYLGIVNGMGSQIFENVTVREITNEEVAQFDRILHGCDWGYYPDPFHYTSVHYDAARMKLYIFGEVRKWKAGNDEAYKAIIESGLYRNEDRLIADSAEPKSISDFRKLDANCVGADKGKDSVKYSMKWLASLSEIIIDNKRCPYASEEFLDYAFPATKNGDLISEYPDKNNHAIDSVRYATNAIWKGAGSWVLGPAK